MQRAPTRIANTDYHNLSVKLIPALTKLSNVLSRNGNNKKTFSTVRIPGVLVYSLIIHRGFAIKNRTSIGLSTINPRRGAGAVRRLH
jgi:hypothetical protein